MAQRTNTGSNLATDPERLELGRLVDWRCPCCNARMSSNGAEDHGLTVDHVLAHIRGGSDLPGNLIPLCASCNSSKRDELLEEWLPKRMCAIHGKKRLSTGIKYAAPVAAHIERVRIAAGMLLTSMRG